VELSKVERGVRTGITILRSGILDALIDLKRRYGTAQNDMIPFSLFGRNSYLALDPAHLGAALHDFDHFRRIEMFLKPMRDALGYTAVTVPDKEWAEMRSRTLRLLSGSILKDYDKIMSRVLDEDTVPLWRRMAAGNAPIDIFREMLEYSSKVVFSAFLGVPKENIPAHLHGTLSEMFDHVRRRVLSFGNLPLWIPTAANRRFRFLKDRVYEFVQANLDRNRESDVMLGVVWRAHAQEGEAGITRMLEEMLGNLIGGSETTIIMMVWTLHYLAHAPELQERLHGELAAGPADIQSLPRDHLLNRCLTETLRIRSPAYIAGREAIAPAQIGNQDIPKGTLIFCSQYITHTDPDLWPNPETFDPDRFTSRPPRNTREFSNFFPFGGGRNICVGQAYAYQEAAVGVSRILKNFRLRPASPFDVGISPELTLRPRTPVRVYAEPRA
jgi:cytochrome P450